MGFLLSVIVLAWMGAGVCGCDRASSKRFPVGVGLLPLFRRFVPPLFPPKAVEWPRRVCEAFLTLGHQALAERDRWPLWLPVALGTGIALYFALPFEPSPAWAGIAAATAAA